MSLKISTLIQLQKKPAALSAALAPLWQTVTNVGAGGEPDKQPMSKEELLIYAQDAFDIDDETHHKLMGEVKEEKVEFLASIIIAYCWKDRMTLMMDDLLYSLQ